VRACVHSVGMLCGYMPISSLVLVFVCFFVDYAKTTRPIFTKFG